MNRLSERIFLTTLMASEHVEAEDQENAVSRCQRSSRTGLLVAALVAGLSSCGNEERMPAPQQGGRTFSAEEIRCLKGYGKDIEKASGYDQKFTCGELSWLMWVEIPPTGALQFLKVPEEQRFQAIQDFVKNMYDHRFTDQEKENFIKNEINIPPRIANSYPRVLSAETIIHLYKRRSPILPEHLRRFPDNALRNLIENNVPLAKALTYPEVLPASIIIDLYKKEPPILPAQLHQRFTDDELKYLVDNEAAIDKALTYSRRWKAEDIAWLIFYGMSPEEADEYPEGSSGKVVGLAWKYEISVDLAEKALKRFPPEEIIASIGKEKPFEAAMEFPSRFSAEEINQIMDLGYSAQYVEQFDSRFNEKDVLDFLEERIPPAEANTFPHRLSVLGSFELRKKGFPLRVIDDYPRHLERNDIWWLAANRIAVGYASDYPENLRGWQIVELWKGGMRGEEASTYTDWLSPSDRLKLKKAGVPGEATQKYHKGFPVDQIIRAEKGK